MGARVRAGVALNPARVVRRRDAPPFRALREKSGLPGGDVGGTG